MTRLAVEGWISPSLRSYAAGLVVLVLLAVGLFTGLVTYRVSALEDMSHKRNAAQARLEIASALVEVAQRSRALAATFAQWDETIQQFGNPTYYEYWRERRAHQVRLAPGYFDGVELYGADGMPLGDEVRGDMPPNVRGSAEQWRLRPDRLEGHAHLYHVYPLSSKQGLRGYIVLELDLDEAIAEVQSFRFVDPASISISAAGQPVTDIRELQSQIAYRPASSWEFEQLRDILLQSLWQFGVGASVLLLLSVFLLVALGSMPLVRLSRHIDELWRHDGPGGMSREAGYLPLAEFDKVRNSLDDYHARLNEGARALRDSEARMRAVLQNVANGILTFDYSGVVTSVNPAVELMFDATADNLLGRHVTSLFVDMGPGGLQRQITGLVADGEAMASRRLELVGRRADGARFPLELGLSRLHQPEGDSFIAVVEDISERKEAQQRLIYLANFDTLTGLPNRVLLRDRLEHAMLQAERNEQLVGLLFLDLDRFKTINDTLGHHAGDDLLRSVAERLKACVRVGDTVARLGGDEFTVVVEGMSHVDDAVLVAEKIRQALHAPLSVCGRDIFVTPSIGITFFPLDDSDADALLRNADAAMYRAKELGGDGVQFYTHDLNTRANERLSMESALRTALERGDFVLHYQPRVDAEAGEVVAVEALLRWHHPDLGWVAPERFVPVLEEIGRIDAVGDWVLRQACRDAVAWRDAGLRPLRMAVNVSARQFRDEGLPGRVRSALHDSGLRAGFLELEITESVLVENVEATAAILQDLNALGVRIALDDFGTGYSALGYLRRFHIDTLKIDRSFIAAVPDNEDDARLVRALVAISRSLGLQVTAEGVETQEQLSFLRGLGCDEVQGFLFSGALSAEAFLAWMRGNRAAARLAGPG